jgi:hypothetical protein
MQHDLAPAPLTAPLPQLASLPGIDPQAKVWIYMADRTLTDAEQAAAKRELATFVRQWTAHQQALEAHFEVVESRILLLMVDETRAGASGCSIDKSVHFLEDLGAALGVDWFDRMQFAWLDDAGQYRFANRADFTAAVQQGDIGPDTPMVNTLAATRAALAEEWFVPFARSWQRRLA